MSDTTTKPPDDLADAGRAFWDTTMSAFDLADHELTLLAEACRTMDNLADLGAVVRSEGVVHDSPQGRRAHPALVEMRQQRIVLIRLLRALGLPDDEPEERPLTRTRTWKPKDDG